MLMASTAWRDRLWANTAFYLEACARLDSTPATPRIRSSRFMLGEAAAAQRMAADLLERGVYAVGFFHPVVPQGAARIRTQISAAHTTDDLDTAVAAFTKCREAL